MKNFAAIKAVCQRNLGSSAKILDEFLLNYAVDKDKLGIEVANRLGTYRHITHDLDKGWINQLKSQYIRHRIMKEGGLIQKYLHHAALSRMHEEERDWLEKQAEKPWKFSFSKIIDSPATDFYTMEDLFTEDRYLLYSSGISRILKQGEIETWFNLIGDNGECWQTYGPLCAFRSFSSDDIFFFATELDPQISSEHELMASVSKNPIPYMMLFARSNYPLSLHEEEVLELVLSEIEGMDLQIEKLEEAFQIDYIGSVYRLRLPDWYGKPHFSIAYYDKEEQFLQLTAMTQKGYAALAAKFLKQGIKVPEIADIYLRPAMLSAASEILNREIELMPLELLFDEGEDAEAEAELDKINQFLALAMPAINANKKPDLEAIANQVGLDLEANRERLEGIFEEVRQKQKK